MSIHDLYLVYRWAYWIFVMDKGQLSRCAQINQAILQNVNYAQTLTPIPYSLFPIALPQLLFSMPTYLTTNN